MSDGLKHAWDWFELHAKQRMQNINFYMIVVAALVAAIGASFHDKAYAISAALGALLALMSALFLGIERRVRNLVLIGEAALRQAEAKLVVSNDIPELALVEHADRLAIKSLTYGKLFLLMFASVGSIGLAIAGYSLYLLEC